MILGRGLSPLQQRILNLADQDDRGVIYAYEILVDVYEFPLVRAGRIGGLHFDRRQPGRRCFSGTVAISRFLTALPTLGLLNVFGRQ